MKSIKDREEIGDIMKKKLYLVRHGQTLFNRQNRIQGWCDSPLTDMGKRQAKAVKNWFAENEVSFDAAYCSTSERCSDTLELITDMPYIRLKELKEMFYGELEGESERLSSKDAKECETYYLRCVLAASLPIQSEIAWLQF